MISVIIPLAKGDSAEKVKKTFYNADEVLEITQGSHAQAKNIGAKRAKGDYLLFIDCDMDLQNLDLRKVEDYAKVHDYDLATCFFHTELGLDYPNVWIQNFNALMLNPSAFLGGFMLVKKEIFKDLGGFMNIYMEDIEFAWRAFLNGKKLGRLPFVVKHTRNFKSPFEWLYKINKAKVK